MSEPGSVEVVYNNIYILSTYGVFFVCTFASEVVRLEVVRLKALSSLALAGRQMGVMCI